jgi:UDP-glucose 4-epimerase
MSILVTGASGFSGSYIAVALANAGFEVTGLYRRGLGFAEPYKATKGLSLVKVDLAHTATLKGPYETIIHTAATSPAPGVCDDDMIHDNRDATGNLADVANELGCQRFVYLSSLSVYGQILVPIIDENTPITQPDTYGKTKFQGEKILAQHATNLPSIALRLPGVIGPGAHRNWLSGIATKLRAGEIISAFNLDQPFNNACHIDDLSKLVISLSQRDWKGFDAVVLGAKGQISVRGAINRLASALGVSANIHEVPAPKPGFTVSSTRAMTHWGYDPMEIGDMIDRFGREV